MRRMLFLLFFVVFYSPAIFAQQGPSESLTLDINVVQIVLNDEHRDGVDWEAIVSDFHVLPLKKEDNSFWMDKRYRLSAGTVSAEDYAVLLDALDTVGKMSQIPQESVRLTMDEPLASTLSLGEGKEQTVRLGLRFASSVHAGPSIVIEPAIGVIFKDGGKPPVALTLKTQTQAAIKENTIIILGGLTEETEITKMHKFPILGNLPLVGLVFRNQGRWMQKTETVIFLIPRAQAVDAEQPQQPPQTQ
ncbi:MAG: hypothetical protein Q7K71_06205 [Candidatus Omnitrophota bacterium]|nr:hypothetical protein [Candidatus Omnitrophota bacterium]